MSTMSKPVHAEFLQYNTETCLYEFKDCHTGGIFTLSPLVTKGAYRLKSETCYELTIQADNKIDIEFDV